MPFTPNSKKEIIFENIKIYKGVLGIEFLSKISVSGKTE